MKVEEIKSLDQCEKYCQGVLNDFETGVITKDKAMEYLYEYTNHLHEFFAVRLKNINDESILTYIQNRASGLNQSTEFSYKGFYNEMIELLNKHKKYD